MWWLLGFVVCYIIVCLIISIGLKIDKHHTIKANMKCVKETIK